MAKIGETRTKIVYFDGEELAQVGGLTIGGLIPVFSLGSHILVKTVAQRLLKFLAPTIAVSQLSKYKFKVSVTEKYETTKVFDTHEWVEVTMWNVIDFSYCETIKK